MKIMYICTGNICRSAMAEAMMRDKIEKNNKLKGKVDVCSSGTFAEEGDGSTQNAIDVMQEYGIDLKGHRATNISNSKIEEMDLILCATNSHKMMVLRMYPNLSGKVYTMKEYIGEKDDIDIKDPWGYDIEVYRMCAAEIEKTIDLTIDKIEKII